MAYSVDDIQAVEAWITSAYDADDGSLDFDNTGCMLNGTVGEDCDEIKEGTICLRIEIGVDPASILTLSIRFYFNSVMTAGTNAVLPYTDANSVSSTNEVSEDYTTPGQWIEHVLDGAFIAELADLGGYCAIRFGADAGVAKSKIGEVNIDMTVETFAIDPLPLVVDDAGDPLVGCEYMIYKVVSTDPLVLFAAPVQTGVSDGSGEIAGLELPVGDYVVLWRDHNATEVNSATDMSHIFTAS